MMSTAAVIGLTPGKRLLNSSFFHCSDPAEKFYYAGSEHGPPASSMRSFVIARSSLSSNYGNGYQPSKPSTHSVKALKDHVVDTASSLPSTASTWFEALNDFVEEENKEGGEGEESFDLDMEALLLLQKSLLEKQWNITFGDMDSLGKRRGVKKEVPVTSSGVSARERRVNRKKKGNVESKSAQGSNGTLETDIGFTPKLLHKRLGRGYMNGGVVSKEYLTHAEVLHLSNIIKAGLVLDERKSRLRERLGCDPTDEQLADSLTISRSELHSRQFAFSLAREKLAMSNVRLVMSIAQKYNRMGAKMGDLVQGGLIGLLRGIEKYDSSKGFKMSTYVYWWIRQGVSKAFLENTSAFPLPNHLHGRLSLIRNARIRLEEKGIDPTIDKIAQMLNMSERKVRNATEADTKVISLDREAYPSVDGVPGASFHHYFADENVENNPWHRLYEWAVKDEVNKLIDSTLHAREQEIIRLYHGIGGKCLTWEDISKRIGLSRERVRQVGLVAFEKLKLAARTKKMDALLVKH
ncbi:RNA polymerase sigma factor sigA [Linum grandiflorum]